MKKYLLSLLLLLAFLQPLVANVVFYNTQDHQIHNISIKSPIKKIPSSKSFGLDSILIDLDDDDITESENANSDWYYQKNSHFIRSWANFELVTLKPSSPKLKHSSKPLYILWSVFRI